MGRSKTKHIVHGALLLTLAAFISKVLSALYRIPLQNLTGDYGFYMYQQVYPLIGTVMILSLYGFPVAISKILVELKTTHMNWTFRKVYLPLLVILYMINGFLFMVIYFFSPYIATYIGDVHLSTAFQMIAFTFLLIPPLALFRGLYQAEEKMGYTAMSQITEQIVRVFIIILMAIGVYVGIISVEKVAVLGGLATIVGMVVTIFLLLLVRRQPSVNTSYNSSSNLSWSYLFRTIISLGMIGALIHMILLLIQFADVMTFIPALQKSGLSALEAMEMKGVFDRGQPLIQFGVVIGSSFALALVSTIMKGNEIQHKYESFKSALRLSFYLAGGATVGLIVLFPEVNRLLFLNDLASNSLRILVISIVLTSIAITCTVMLQSLGYMKWVTLFIMLTFTIKYGLNVLLIPKYSLYGASIGTVGSLLFLCCANIILLKRKLSVPQLFSYMKLHKFLIASGGMTLYLFFMKYVTIFIDIPSRIALFIFVMILVSTGALVYVSLLLRYDTFSEKELMALPFSTKLLGLKQIVKRK